MRYVAFLRAINTGQRRVKNPQLSEVVERVGGRFAQGFLASGNVVFDADIDEGFVERLEAAYLDALGFDVPVMLRDAAEVLHMADQQPFTDAELAASEGKLYVAITKSPPDTDKVEQVLDMATERDRLSFSHGDLYWLPEAGEYMSDISVPGIERILGPMTVRGQSTVKRLAAKFLD